MAGWAFLELSGADAHWAYDHLPPAIGFSATPWWWPLPILGIAGVPIASGMPQATEAHSPRGRVVAPGPSMLPGVLLAAVAGIGLAPPDEAPLIVREAGWRPHG